MIKNKKTILRFLFFFIIGFIVIWFIEFLLHKFFNIDIHNLEFGWIGLIIVYGFKYHIFCCLLPAIWAGYKCKHKSCEHEQCK